MREPGLEAVNRTLSVIVERQEDELKSQDAEIGRLRAALERIAETAAPDIAWYWFRDTARTVLGCENG